MEGDNAVIWLGIYREMSKDFTYMIEELCDIINLLLFIIAVLSIPQLSKFATIYTWLSNINGDTK